MGLADSINRAIDARNTAKVARQNESLSNQGTRPIVSKDRIIRTDNLFVSNKLKFALKCAKNH